MRRSHNLVRGFPTLPPGLGWKRDESISGGGDSGGLNITTYCNPSQRTAIVKTTTINIRQAHMPYQSLTTIISLSAYVLIKVIIYDSSSMTTIISCKLFEKWQLVPLSWLPRSFSIAGWTDVLHASGGPGVRCMVAGLGRGGGLSIKKLESKTSRTDPRPNPKEEISLPFLGLVHIILLNSDFWLILLWGYVPRPGLALGTACGFLVANSVLS